MALNSTQCQTLADDMAANTNQAVIDALASGNNSALQEWYNGVAAPSFWVIISEVPVDDIVAAIEWDTDYVAFKDDVPALAFLLSNGTYGPQPPGAREALNQVFSGANATKNAVLAVATRLASYAEAIFAETTTGPGGGDGSSQATSAIPIVEGNLSLSDIQCAVALIP